MGPLDEIRELLRDRRKNFCVEIMKKIYLSFDRYSWVGIYLLKGDELVLECYYGKETIHKRIKKGVGICGLAAQLGKKMIIPDVRKEPNYLECFLTTRSEIVVPIRKNGKILGVLDVDSDILNAFSFEDEKLLEKIVGIIAEFF